MLGELHALIQHRGCKPAIWWVATVGKIVVGWVSTQQWVEATVSIEPGLSIKCGIELEASSKNSQFINEDSSCPGEEDDTPLSAAYLTMMMTMIM